MLRVNTLESQMPTLHLRLSNPKSQTDGFKPPAMGIELITRLNIQRFWAHDLLFTGTSNKSTVGNVGLDWKTLDSCRKWSEECGKLRRTKREKKQANKTWKNIWHLQLNLPRACFASYKVEHLNVRKQPQIWDCKCLKYQMKVREG